MKRLRVDISNQDGACSMTGIVVEFEDNEKDFDLAKAKALGHIVHELSRYGLHEALSGIGISPPNYSPGVAPLTRCNHPDCGTWRSKPCGEGCFWQPAVTSTERGT